MNRIAALLTLCVACTVLRAVIVALVVALMLALLWSFIRQPRETLVLLATLALMGLAHSRPVAFLAVLGVVGVAAVIFGNRRPSAADGLSPRRPARSLIELEPRSKA